MAKFYAKAPDGTDATLSITVEGFTQSLQQNGWCKMPNGLILQWGKIIAKDTYQTKFTFPIPFNKSSFIVELTRLDYGYEWTLIAEELNNISCSWVTKGMNNNGGGSASAYLIVIGNQKIVKFQWSNLDGYTSKVDVPYPIAFPSKLYHLATTNVTKLSVDDTGGWGDCLGGYYGSATLSYSQYSIYETKRCINVILIGS